MSQDIRSFFTVLSKKSAPQRKPKKPIVLSDSEDEVVENTPEKPKKLPPSKRRAKVLSSDSEDEGKSKKAKSPTKKKTLENKPKKDEKPKLKPIDLDAINRPIKQSEVKHVVNKDSSEKDVKKTDKPKKKRKEAKNTELGIHGDKDFEKTLEELDADSDDTIFMDLDILDKTIEEATLLEHSSKDKVEESSNKKSEAKKNNKDDHKTPRKAEKRPRKTSESTPTPNKKKKLEQTDSGIDQGIDQDLENFAKKRQSAGLYVAYLHRGGPKHHGEKEYPKGKPDCLAGLTFLRTGVLDSLEGEEFQDLVSDHGGKFVHSVSKKVNYVVVGDQPGPMKLEKARQYNLPEISEDQFLDIILTKSGMKPRYAVKAESEDLGIGGSEESSPKSEKSSSHSEKGKEQDKSPDKKEEPRGNSKEQSESSDSKLIEENSHHRTDKAIKKEEQEVTHKEESKHIKIDVKNEPKDRDESKITATDNTSLSWTDKYKPTNIKGIIGQQEPNSNMNKLKRWLENWFKNAENKKKSSKQPSSYSKGRWNDDANFKAALLSGPPGVGKTTIATLVAKELGFDVVEFNASDTRSKKLLHEEISHMMESKTVAGFATGQSSINQKRVLLMDEVDGMAGNEDRGGIAELISFIKTAKFPIICMCNNRDLPKMRSLVNYCLALRFGKPNVAQVRGAMMSICFKEGLDIKPDALAQLIIGTGCDIRQTLNHLSMWSAADKSISTETVQNESKKSQKDVVIGVWDVIKKVFNKSENNHMTLADKSKLFFYDYSFGPMFVQENYLYTDPECTGPKEHRVAERFNRFYQAASSLSQSDLIETKIRNTNNWSLLESQAFFSTVIPSQYLSGRFEQVRFPTWFGKNSQRNKNLRIISELYSHARTSISGDRSSMLDYTGPLLKRLLTPLIEKQTDGIDDTLEVMKSYSLLREDLTNLCDLRTSFGRKNPFDNVTTSVKAALTRKYNKTMVLSFAPPAASKKKKGAIGESENLLGEEEEYSEEDENDDDDDDKIANDGLIKVKTRNPAQAGTSKASKPQKETKSKGKATKSRDQLVPSLKRKK